MSDFTNDYSTTKATKFEILPKGEYLLRITDAVPGKAKSSGRNMVTVHYDVVKPDLYKGRKIMFHNVVFVADGEPGAGKTAYYLKCINQPHEGKFEVNTKNWIGQKITAKVGIESYNGRDNNKVLDFDMPDYTVESPAVPDEEVPF